MRRALAAALLVALAAVATLVYLAVARERGYRDLLTQADALLATGDTAGAIEALSGAIALRPSAMLGWLLRGETYRQRGDLTAAVRDLRRAVELSPTATQAIERLGDTLFGLERYAGAAGQFEAYIALDDRNPRVYYKLALARFRAGQPDQAEAALGRALALQDALAEAHYLLGLCYLQQLRRNEALSALTRAVELAPALLPAREELARLYGARNRHSDELRQLETLAGLDADRVDRHTALARAYAGAGRTDLAVQVLARAAERFPDSPEIDLTLGRVWLDIAEGAGERAALGKALEALSRAVTRVDSSEALTLYARALLRANDRSRALALLRQAALRLPVAVDTHRLLADVAERSGRLQLARDALRADAALHGAEESGRVKAQRATRLASLSERLDDPREAAAWYARAADALPNEAGLIQRLVAAQLRAGMTAEAKTTLERALARQPDDAALLQLQGRLQTTQSGR